MVDNSNINNDLAIYLQHYLAPSMTFIYRQIIGINSFFNPIVLCSDRLENTDKFPFDKIFLKRRNFARLKKSRIFNAIFGPHTLLSISPHLSSQQLKYFTKILIENRIKLIHAHFGPSGIEICKLANKLNIPLIVNFHGYDASFLLNMKDYVKNIKMVFDNSFIIAVSENMKSNLVSMGANENNIRVIKYGIPLEYFDIIQRVQLKQKIKRRQTITFLQISNFVEKKGHKYTVLAFSEYLKYNKNAKLILAGDGFLRTSIEQLCSELKISEYVHFPGLVNSIEVKSLMAEADIFLHHSVRSKLGDMEGIPNVIMEAMATGLPVVSTFHSGIPELIINNYNGYLIREKDIDSYVKILMELENLPEDIGIRARTKIVEEFNLEKQTLKLVTLYNEIINLHH